jgi:hypothetical protein
VTASLARWQLKPATTTKEHTPQQSKTMQKKSEQYVDPTITDCLLHVGISSAGGIYVLRNHKTTRQTFFSLFGFGHQFGCVGPLDTDLIGGFRGVGVVVIDDPQQFLANAHQSTILDRTRHGIHVDR